MKNKIVIILATILALFLIVGCSQTEEQEVPEPTPAPVEEAAVSEESVKPSGRVITAPEFDSEVIDILGKDGFSANEITVNVGSSLTWKNDLYPKRGVVLVFQNQDNKRSTTSGNILPGATFEKIFDEPGNYLYWDVGAGVKAEIVVTE